jgi:uncharacterized protein (DUF58 family)
VIRFDEKAVEKAATGLRLRLPRAAQRGKVGEVRANSVGSSMELHDFRLYQPGDDVRHVDWNAVARTGEVVLRVRREEVTPRLEVVLDASKSMAISEEKAARAREIALFAGVLAQRGGLEVALIVAGAKGEKATGPNVRVALRNLEMDGRDAFDEALRRAPPLRPCGLRVVVSDLLFQATAAPLADRLARGTSGLCLVQVLDVEDRDPSGGSGARLVDAESDEFLERILVPSVIEDYRERFEAHQKMWRDAAHRVAAELVTVSADEELPVQARGALAVLTETA